MSADACLREGGLVLSGARVEWPQGVALRDGADVSWLSRCRVGDNQGQDGACVIFALASWAEIVHDLVISDDDCQAVYRRALAAVRRPDGGLTFAEGFDAARRANWLPAAARIELVHNLTALGSQPILAAYDITPAWDRTNAAGCLDHTATGATRGGHAVVIAAHGSLNGILGGPWVYVENSWGREWGWNGIGVMAESLHAQLCRELWVIR